VNLRALLWGCSLSPRKRTIHAHTRFITWETKRPRRGQRNHSRLLTMTDPVEAMDTQHEEEEPSSSSSSSSSCSSSVAAVEEAVPSTSSSASGGDVALSVHAKETLRKLREQDEARRARLQTERARQLMEFENADLPAKERLEALLRQTENWAYTVRSQPGEGAADPARVVRNGCELFLFASSSFFFRSQQTRHTSSSRERSCFSSVCFVIVRCVFLWVWQAFPFGLVCLCSCHLSVL
jgi:hypothetical protein